MHGAAQSVGRSPKTSNGTTTGAGQIKHGADNAQNGSSSFSQGKGKKRELGVQGSDPVKRERIARAEDAEYDQLRPGQILKSEISKITDRGGLVDFVCVEKLVQLMQPDSVDKKLDLNCRFMLATVISVTDRFECLTQFVQLRGLLVLDDWLQVVHTGKLDDGSSPKGNDKSVEDFLLVLLRALDKLPVNLHALQTCNIGKSVNNLRSHKNSDIQKKARSLVDTWKRRVEAEMNMIDANSGSSGGASWPNKSEISDVLNAGGRRIGRPSNPPSIQSCTSSTQPPPAKTFYGEEYSSASPGSSRPSISGNVTSGVGSSKDPNSVALGGVGSSDILLTTIKEEKSNSSSKSQNNSQSCSSDNGKTVAGQEYARSSTAESVNVNKISSCVSCNRKSSNGIYGTAIFSVQMENNFGKFCSINRMLSSEKVLPDVPLVDSGNTQRLIVRLPNTGRSPARSASGGSPEDVSAALCKGSPLVQPQKLENEDRNVKGRSEPLRNKDAANGNTCLSQEKDELARCDEVKVTSVVALVDENSRDGKGSDELTEASKATSEPSGIIASHRKSYESSFSSMNALVDSCAKFLEANVTASVPSVASVGDDIGMNLLASVAAGEISRSDVSPLSSSNRNSPVPEDSCSGNDVQWRKIDDDCARSEDLCDESNGDAMTENTSLVKPGVQHNGIGVEEKIEEFSAQLNSSIIDLPHNGSALSSDVKLSGSIVEYSAAMLHVEVKKDVVDGADGRLQVQGKLGVTWASDGNASNLKLVGTSVKPGEGKTICGPNDKALDNGLKFSPESASTYAKIEAEATEESMSYSSSERHEDRKAINILSGNSNIKEQSPLHIAKPSGSCIVSAAEAKVEKDDEMKIACHTEQVGDQILDKQLSTFDHTSDISHGNLEKREVNGICSSDPVPMASPTPPLVEREVTMRSTRCKSDGPEDSVLNNSSITSAGVDTTVKLDFDLNEGFPADDGSSAELVILPMTGKSSSVSLPFFVPISVSSFPGNGNSLVTVTAAAKGPLAPPENPLRIKGELGWKGSAATSAFHPAEPRKITDISLGTTDTPLVDNSTSKSGRTFLDFDLNVPEQRALEDVASLNFIPVTHTESHISESSIGGLNLDLNRCDETPEIAQSSSRLEMAMLPGRSAPCGRVSNAESLSSRDFDLNNGPGQDDMGNDAAPLVKNGMPFLSSVPTVRMNNMELGNFSSWFPPGTSYVPPFLQGRGGEQSFPIFQAATSQRILGPPSANNTFTPEIFRGSILPSSPAIGFPPNTPFQYPGFPFDTNFSLSSSSYSSVSTPFVDSSSGGPLCFPAVPSQLIGPNGVVSTQYSLPYGMSLPGGTSNIVPESRKWGDQGLVLNAGPMVSEIDRRDESLHSTLRLLPITGSQALTDEQMKMYQMAGGFIKRKEPDGGWDANRISYKNTSWQ